MDVVNVIRQWWSRHVAARGKDYEPRWVPEWNANSTIAPTYQAIVREGHQANGVVFACVSALVNGYGEAVLRVGRVAGPGIIEPVERGPLARLLREPNEQMGQGELLEYLMLYTALGGQCFLQKIRSKAGRVVGLVPYHDGNLEVVGRGGGPLVDHYEYVEARTGERKVLSREDIVHIKWQPDPLRPYRGLAPLVAVAREVDTDNEAARYVFTLLRNDAMPRIVIKTAPGTPPLQEADYTRFRAQWSERHGMLNRGGVALLNPGMEAAALGLGLDKLALNTLRGVPEARICAAFRVHPIIAAMSVGLEASTYHNYEEARLDFTERTLGTLWRRTGNELGQNLRHEFALSDEHVLYFDTSGVAALQTREKEKREWVGKAVKEYSIMKVNEARLIVGLPPEPGQDIFLRPTNVTPIAKEAPPPSG